MPYELRAKGRAVQTFDTEDEAAAGARELILTQPDSDPEIWDTTTGKPAAPAASKAWREDLSRKVADAPLGEAADMWVGAAVAAGCLVCVAPDCQHPSGPA
jgi:hypothetical protein